MQGNRFFPHPQFEDEDATRSADVLGTLLSYVSFTLVLLTVIGIPFVYEDRVRSAAVLAGLWGIVLTARWLLKRGRIHMASSLFVTGFWLTFAAITYTSGGLESINATLLVAISAVAALLLGLKATIASALAGAALFLGFVVMDALGYEPVRVFFTPPIARMTMFLSAVLLAAFPLHLVLRSLDQSLKQAKWQFEQRMRAQEEKQRLEKMLSKAQKMESIGRMAGAIAHDFNNMLTGISGYASLALRNPKVAEAGGGALQEILRATERASKLTRQLLAFSRAQHREPRFIDIDQELDGMWPMLRQLAGNGVTLNREGRADRPTIYLDPVQLEQVVMNLVVNARDAMPEGGAITLRTSNVTLPEPNVSSVMDDAPPGPYLLLEVEDTGTGIPEDVREHIFEPFFTTKGNSKGTGLGLATVYGIVTQNGGAVDLVSEENQGTTFRIFLPCPEGGRERKPVEETDETEPLSPRRV